MSVVMYPDLENRRNFVHDIFVIALKRQNEELKMALSRDPYFYIKRKELLVLLQTNDINMIKHLISLECNLNISSDSSFKLIAIKEAQVKKNSMTTLSFLDFISVMIENKRDNNANI